MSSLDSFNLPELASLEATLDARVLVFAASHLDMELLPTIYNLITTLPGNDELYVLLYGRGGEINAARRIAILLNDKFKAINFIVPYYCQSSFTTLALSGNNILTGPMSCFSPIDTHFQMRDDQENTPDVIASEDIRKFSNMAEKWFGLCSKEHSKLLLENITQNIFPTTLTSLYRSIEEQKKIATELLTFNKNITDANKRKKIVNTLMFDYHSHSYALTGKDLESLNLNITENIDVFSIAWNAINRILNIIGGQARVSPEDPRNDCLIMTRDNIHIRQHFPQTFAPKWYKKEF